MEYLGKQGNQNKKNLIEIDDRDDGRDGNGKLGDEKIDLKKKDTDEHESEIVNAEQEKEYSGFEMRVFTDLCSIYIVQQQVLYALDMSDLFHIIYINILYIFVTSVIPLTCTYIFLLFFYFIHFFHSLDNLI